MKRYFMGNDYRGLRWLWFGLAFMVLSLSAAAQDGAIPLPTSPDGASVSPDTSPVLDESIAAPFTENLNTPSSTRFRVVYPSLARPAAITKKFVKPGGNRPAHEGVDLYAPAGTPVQAGASGVVKKIVPPEQDTLGYGGYIKIRSSFNGVKYRVIYGNLQNIAVSTGQRVNVGDILGQSRGNSMKLVIQTGQGGISGFQIGGIAHPKRHLVLPALRLRPTVQNLRLRAAPGTDSEILGLVNPWQLLKTPASTYKALLKAGKTGKWLPVTLKNGRVAYVAAWYVQVVSRKDPGVMINAPVRGVNIDLYSANGLPGVLALANVGWVRLSYNVSYNPANGSYGNTDLTAAYNRYQPVMKQYAGSGNRVILVLTHQLFGEGQGYNWTTMDNASWAAYTAQYAAYVQAVAAQYANQGIVYAYQIWNEQDAPVGSPSAVGMPTNAYANLLAASIQAIRSVDSKALIITGGHTTGPVAGVNYANATLAQMPYGIRPDGIAVHPYGRGPAGSPFSIYGSINESIASWSTVMPGEHLWITEWGVLNLNGDDGYAQVVTDYVNGFLYITETQYRGAVAAAVWYGWSDGMDNGYGLVRANGTPRFPLYSAYLQTDALLRAFG